MEKFFRFAERGTTARVELLAGLTTFLTMAYITVVNPGILQKAGMPFAGVLFATVLVSALSSILMGLLANLPFALAPGMGLNAFFTYTLVIGKGLSWQTALGAVFISGVALTLLSLTPARVIIVRAVPGSLRSAVAAGIGLFLTLIGLSSVGFIVGNEATLIGFGGVTPATLLFVVGLLFTVFLLLKRVPGALILGIVATSLLAWAVSRVGVAAGWLARPLVSAPAGVFALPTLDVFMKLDVGAALKVSLIGPIFALMFTDLFDSVATFLGVAQVAGLIDRRGEPAWRRAAAPV